MAKIVSFSIGEGDFANMARLERELGFSKRSELLRAGINGLSGELNELSKLSGRVAVVAVVVYERACEGEIHGVKHEFEDVIATQLHNSFSDRCVEVFILNGEAARVKALAKRMRSSRHLKSFRLTVI